MLRNPDQTRARILRKSGALFNRQGYQATSISDITRATGYTKGAIYRHFGSKEELETATLNHLSAIIVESLRARVVASETAGDKLRAVFRFFETYVTKPIVAGGCPLLNAAIEADDAHPALRKEALRILDTLQQAIVTILRNGIRFGQIRADVRPDQYATLMIASLEGAIMMSRLRRNQTDIRRIVAHLEEQLAAIET